MLRDGVNTVGVDPRPVQVRLTVEAAAHDDVQSCGLCDLSQHLRLATEAHVGAIDQGAASSVPKTSSSRAMSSGSCSRPVARCSRMRLRKTCSCGSVMPSCSAWMGPVTVITVTAAVSPCGLPPGRDQRVRFISMGDRHLSHHVSSEAFFVQFDPQPGSRWDNSASVTYFERGSKPWVEQLKHLGLQLLNEEVVDGRGDVPRGSHPDAGHGAVVKSDRTPGLRKRRYLEGFSNAVAHDVRLGDVDGLTPEPREKRRSGS